MHNQEWVHESITRLRRTLRGIPLNDLHLDSQWFGIVLFGKLTPYLFVLLQHPFGVRHDQGRKAKGIIGCLKRKCWRFHHMPARLDMLSAIACGFEVFNR